MTAAKWSVILAVALCFLSSRGLAGDGQGYLFNIQEENDKYSTPSTDKHYTQGLHLTLMWPDDQVPWLLRPLSWIPTLGVSDAIGKYGVTGGQNIYTPENIQSNKLIRTDRPYAGWLYVGFIRENRGLICGDIPTRDHWEADLGVTGPDSLADTTQYWYHGFITVHEPEGWNYQINTEPGIVLRFRRDCVIWQTAPNDGLQAQLIPGFGANLGNIDISAQLGTTLRIGHNIPDDFGKTITPQWGWYVFGGPEVNAVLRNEFLDGNVFSDSPSVAKEPAFLHLRLGFAVQLKQIEISYTYNYLTPQFKKQTEYDGYGSIDFTYRF